MNTTPDDRSPAVAGPVDWPVRQRKCSRPQCNGDMTPGIAMGQTFTGIADFIGGDVATISPGGPGVLMACLKCNVCGHSVSA